MSFIGLEGRYNFTSFGASLEYGQFTRHGSWSAGLSWNNNIADVVYSGKSIGNFDYAHAVAEGEYRFRFISTRSRVFNAYVGMGLFLGVEWIDPRGAWKGNPEMPYSGVSFLYGVQPCVDLEVFVLPRMALELGFGVPVNFSSRIRKVNYYPSLGVMYEF